MEEDAQGRSGDAPEEGSMVDKAKVLAEDLAEKAKPVMDKAGDVAGDLAEKAKPMMDKAGEVAGGLLDKAKRMFEKDDAGDDAAG